MRPGALFHAPVAHFAVLVGLMTVTPAGDAGAQVVEGPLAPAGRLRVQVAPLFSTYDRRFGRRVEDGGEVVREVEPLGFDLTRDAAGSGLLPGLEGLEDDLRAVLGNPAFRVSVGRTRARIQATTITVPLRADVGVTDWLTVGATVPMVRTRSEVAFLLDADSTTANLGLNPRLETPSRVTDFTETVAAAIDALEARSAARCDGRDATALECADIDAALSRARTLRDVLSDAYANEGLFPLRASTTGAILTGRMEDLSNRFAGHGVEGFPETLPLAEGPLTREQFDAYLSDPTFGIGGDTLDTRQSRWRPGDVEIHAAARLLEKPTTSDPGGLLDRTSLLLGVGATLRLGTGEPDAPDRFTDLGSGDGQTDAELRVFGDAGYAGRFGVRIDGRYGIQMEGDRVRRIAPPEAVLAPAALSRAVRWTPGDYLSVEVAPRIDLTPQLALAARYRYYRKGEDEYALAGSPDDQPGDALDPALLELETEQVLQQLGVGLVYSTLESSRTDPAVGPLEVHALYRSTLAGSGGLTPRESSMRVGLRLFWSLWGE